MVFFWEITKYTAVVFWGSYVFDAPWCPYVIHVFTSIGEKLED
ncbi:Probable bis(5'-adenosyl)-triphosphatase, HIT family [Thermococcus sibiricus MM 739]|uniref:Probable bis(5'-adenosyl)-triphosphatase, HIT family n=1 Tax=Thermococcus sibiricus (strain DSM 12597 / MM 739) TaxID=604354 RepID=C6A4T7_THESM|nr:Probable bis(5'-adenosyl)-triphosphatase, HIT family [Thermococcus sibiricus MM 739]